jgi:flagellar hook-associated protein FlgK
MTYSHNPSDPMVVLATTAKSLVDQYNNNSITLQQFKDSMNSQVVPQVAGLNKSSHNDDAWHTISSAVALVGSPD